MVPGRGFSGFWGAAATYRALEVTPDFIQVGGSSCFEFWHLKMVWQSKSSQSRDRYRLLVQCMLVCHPRSAYLYFPHILLRLAVCGLSPLCQQICPSRPQMKDFVLLGIIEESLWYHMCVGCSLGGIPSIDEPNKGSHLWCHSCWAPPLPSSGGCWLKVLRLSAPSTEDLKNPKNRPPSLVGSLGWPSLAPPEQPQHGQHGDSFSPSFQLMAQNTDPRWIEPEKA